MTAPQWAQDLILQVLENEGCERIPELSWHRSKKSAYSSGHCSETGIHITAGTGNNGRRIAGYWRKEHGRDRLAIISPRQEQKLTLLHELAHWLTPKTHHGPKFWDKAWQLYRRYRPAPIGYIKIREGNYRKEAIAAYRRSRKEGAL